MTCPFGRTYDSAHASCKSCIKQGMGCVPQELKLEPLAEKKTSGPNKTEISYQNALKFEFQGIEIRFEGIRLTMSNGHAYTPDFAVLLPNVILLVEVKARGKNGFRQPSYQRAKLAFDQCRVEYPQFRYRWAEKYNGEWIIKDF